VTDGKYWFHVTLAYRTRQSVSGQWQGDVFATWEAVFDVAETMARRDVRGLVAIGQGSAKPIGNNQSEK
jgi:hypothetical protein